MMFILGMLLGILIGMLLIAVISTKTIKTFTKQNIELITENSELKDIRLNAERRATNYARKIKRIEDIALQNGQGSIVERFDKIKELFTTVITK